MIIDDYVCVRCDWYKESWRDDPPPQCKYCGRDMIRVFPKPKIDVFKPYYDESLDKFFKTRAEKKLYLKEHNLLHYDRYNSQPKDKKGVIYSLPKGKK